MSTSVKKIKLSKKVLAFALAVIMVMGCSITPKAAYKDTGVHSTSGSYVLSVWETDGVVLLGKMYLNKYSGSISNNFTASQDCGSTTVYVGSNSSVNTSKSANSVSAGTSVVVTKSGSYSKAYGRCTVTY